MNLRSGQELDSPPQGAIQSHDSQYTLLILCQECQLIIRTYSCHVKIIIIQ